MSNSPSDKSSQHLQEKTREELLIEVGLLRRRLAELEEAEEQRQHAEKDLAEREKRFADITELAQKREAEVRAMELEKLDRLRSALLASVSHELRTPLTLIKGISKSLLLTDVQWDNGTRQDFLQTIEHEAGTLTHIVENLEKMAQLEAGIISMDKRKCRISEIIPTTSGQLREIARDHRLHIALQSQMPYVIADPDYIQDVLVHLVSNAVLFSETNTQININGKLADDQIIVSVTDEGIGIPADQIEQVFDRFHRVESGVAHRRGGTGLGLSICKSIIERHDGQIWVESEPGKGSTFSFSLPALKED